MDVRVDAGGRQDQMRARDGVGGQADLQARCNAIHRLRIAGLADRADAAVLDAHIRFHHAQHRVDHGHVGDHEVGSTARPRHLIVHAHAFAHALATAEDELVAVAAAQIALYFDEQARIAQADAVTGRRTEEADIFLPGHGSH